MMKHRPIYIVSGFLGAGKTTLLNRILTETHGYKFAVIINEFGQIGLDADLITTSPDFVKMDNGCLCCVLNEDLAITLRTLKDRVDYDAVILETTGIADPLPIAWTFFREELTDAFRFGGIVTVVDVLHFAQSQKLADEVRCQIERADYIYLAKTKLASKQQCLVVEESIKQIQPCARFIQDSEADFYNLIFDVNHKIKLSTSKHNHQHKHDFQTLSYDLQNFAVSLNDMEDFFEALPKTVYRAKAIFKDSVSQNVYAMHAVCGRVEFYECEKAIPRGLVLIGKNLDAKQIESLTPFG